MDGFADILTERVRTLADDARRSLLTSGHVNSIAVYDVGGHERVAILEVARIADPGVRRRHLAMVKMTAELLGMPTDVLVAAVTASRAVGPGSRASGPGWTRRVVRRLRALRPGYCLFAFEASALSTKDPAMVQEAERLAREHRLWTHPDSFDVVMVVGLNPIRCVAHLIPFTRTPDGVSVGDETVKDSMRGDGHIGGLFGTVYLPGQS